MPIVTYTLDDDTLVRFEVATFDGFRPVAADSPVAAIRSAVAPAVEGARAVLESVRSVAPDEVVVRFGVKVSGTANWLVAKAATEGNFEITLTWKAPGAT